MRLNPIRCYGCNKMLGESDGERLIIRKLGLIIRGSVTWCCGYCGKVRDIDLREAALTR